jgi:quercetin dioxygenase-like cupin family protein
MKIQAIESHEQTPVTVAGAKEAKMRMLIGPKEGAPNFHMRHFEVGRGGNTPDHAHDYEHGILVLKGEGVAKTVDGDRPFKAGDVMYIPPNEHHSLVNTSAGPCEFICLIPAPKDRST